MRITPHADMYELKAGKFVAIATNQGTFFSLITDLKLEVSNPDIVRFPPHDHEKLLKQFLPVTVIYATASLRPLLMLAHNQRPSPVKTIPSHFAPVHAVDQADVARIFGDEQVNRRYFNIGCPLDMDTPICINLEHLTERSTGIFGKTGTGKTFLTRLLLAGLVHNDKATVLIFDMHSEYGLQARKESSPEPFVKGLKTLFPDKVALFSLDPSSTRRRGGSPDGVLTMSYQSVAVEDIISLQEELSLHPTACEAAHLVAAKYKQQWLTILLKQGERLKEFAQEVGAHPESIAALYRKLRAIERLPFFTAEAHGDHDSLEALFAYLNQGISIIIEFGNYTSTFCYLLIANIITRRIHALYTKKTEHFLATHAPQDEPKKLMIVIEEAHKFLNPVAARQTIFATIAREMRKYYVSLLIVDQRPSGIDAEVLSQLGTKIVAQLNDDRDMQAVLAGVSNAAQLRSIVASLESKKQALVLGHAVPMPIVIEIRPYDAAFYKAVQPTMSIEETNRLIHELF
jgi:uncharacterized protein